MVPASIQYGIVDKISCNDNKIFFIFGSEAISQMVGLNRLLEPSVFPPFLSELALFELLQQQLYKKINVARYDQFNAGHVQLA